MVKRSIVVILVVTVLLIAANDGWRYVEAQRRLRDTTYAVARWAAENSPSMSRDRAATAIAGMAAPSDVTITMYGQTTAGVEVWTQADVSGTIVAGTLANLLLGKNLNEAISAPFVIKDYRRAGIK